MRNIMTVMSMLAIASGPAWALESATTGSQATQATVGVINSKVDVTNNFINAMMKCNAARKFYAPADPKKDADGCVGVGDYDLNMASGSNVNLANGRAFSTQGASGGYAVYGVSTNAGYGLYGNSPVGTGVGLLATGGPSNWAGEFITNGYGILAYLNSGAYTSKWAGEFYGGNGVYIGNTSNNASLCLNGVCRTRFTPQPVSSYERTGWYGQYTVCNSGDVVTAVCTSGKNPDCGGTFTRIICTTMQ